MADYTVSVTFAGIGLGAAMTPAAIRDALETLTAGNRLDAAYIDNMPAAGGTDTGAQIVTKLEALSAGSRLSATKLDDLVKTNVLRAEKALNYLYTGNVWGTTLQAAYPSADILPGDFFIASAINTSTNGTTVETGDWCIALTSNPGFNFADTTKWLVVKISKLPTRELAFRKNNDSTVASGIMPYDIEEYKSFALATYSFATGKDCITTATAVGAISTGNAAVASRIGARAFASGRFAYSGDAQFQENVLRLATTNATPTEMILPGAITIADGKTYDFKVRLVARAYGGTPVKSWEWKALISAYRGTVIGSVGTATIQSIGPSTMAASLYFSSSPNKIYITCTGMASTVVSWVAYVEAVEVFMNDGTGNINEITEEENNSYVD